MLTHNLKAYTRGRFKQLALRNAMESGPSLSLVPFPSGLSHMGPGFADIIPTLPDSEAVLQGDLDVRAALPEKLINGCLMRSETVTRFSALSRSSSASCFSSR